jgi:hypothetical protein
MVKCPKKPFNTAGFSLAPVFFLILLGSGPAFLPAQVDQDELSQNQGPVFFINYEGPHARIESRQQIRNIGYTLGTAARGGNLRPGGGDRYFVIHSVSDPEGNKLDADVFGLGIDVGVDHIRNLRFIIQGYLEGAYGYNAQDAALLAEYITVYNAVYRGNWDYFSSRYKTAVLGNLSREKAGLSIRYDDWPGQTLMLIPLGPGGAGSLSAINTSSLVEEPVTGELRKNDDMGIDSRKDMVDLLERESLEAEERAEDQRAAIAQEETRLTQERQETAQGRQQAAQERQEIAQERQQTREDAAAGRVSPREAQKTEEQLAARETAVEQREEELDQKDEELDQREESLTEQREEAQKTEEFAEQKAQEAQDQRGEIARDQQALIVREENPPPADRGILAAALSGPASPLGWLLQFNPATGRELKRSVLNTVNPRTLSSLGNRLFAVAGENRGAGAIRLVEISPETLELIQQGQDDIAPGSLLWLNGPDLYAITSSGGNLYLGRFSGDTLARTARSSVQIHPYATVSFQEGVVLTQRTDGTPLVLNSRDLSERK